MIKTSNLLKLYNAGKPNEIKAINNVSLELPDKGLVIILGKSGCGKTTLMNCLGGLDSLNSGVIELGGETMARYDSKKWDAVRNANVGYIFQNYNLINNITVLRNVELGLEIAGMSDKTQIRKRALYALEIVGMLKYKNRLPSALSGGQQQRVGIARALAKAPSVIFADEPTGNLDDKNTLAIMDILKGLSEHCLVVLVTHERSIAGYYADRIINIVDGAVVSDEVSDATGALRHKASNEIYLGDLQQNQVEISDKVALKLYADKPLKEPVELSLIYNDGQLYVRADTAVRVRYLDENSETKLINSAYKPLTDGERAEDKYELNSEILSPIQYKERSLFSTRKILRDWLKRKRSKKARKGHFLDSVMIILGIVLIMLSAVVANSIVFNPLTDVTYDSALIGVKVDGTAEPYSYDFDALNNKIKDYTGVSRVLANDMNASAILRLSYNPLSNSAIADLYTDGPVRLMPVSVLDNQKMVAGRLPQNENEIAVDMTIINRYKEDGALIQMGITDTSDLMGEYMSVKDWGSKKIVGFVDRGAPSIYVLDALYYATVVSNVSLYIGYDEVTQSRSDTSYASGSIKLIPASNISSSQITTGRLPQNNNEVVVDLSILQEFNAQKTEHIENVTDWLGEHVSAYELNDVKKIVGITDNHSMSIYYNDTTKLNVNTHAFETFYERQSGTEVMTKWAVVYATDKKAAINALNEAGYQTIDFVKYTKTEHYRNAIRSSSVMVVIMVLLLLISLLSISKQAKSSFILRIRELGIMRAIGATKRNIMKLFLVEGIAATLTSSVFGMLLSSIYLWYSLTYNLSFKMLFYMPVWLALPLIIVVGAISVYFYCLNALRLLSKTPSEILSKYDI